MGLTAFHVKSIESPSVLTDEGSIQPDDLSNEVNWGNPHFKIGQIPLSIVIFEKQLGGPIERSRSALVEEAYGKAFSEKPGASTVTTKGVGKGSFTEIDHAHPDALGVALVTGLWPFFALGAGDIKYPSKVDYIYDHSESIEVSESVFESWQKMKYAEKSVNGSRFMYPVENRADLEIFLASNVIDERNITWADYDLVRNSYIIKRDPIRVRENQVPMQCLLAEDSKITVNAELGQFASFSFATKNPLVRAVGDLLKINRTPLSSLLLPPLLDFAFRQVMQQDPTYTIGFSMSDNIIKLITDPDRLVRSIKKLAEAGYISPLRAHRYQEAVEQFISCARIPPLSDSKVTIFHRNGKYLVFHGGIQGGSLEIPVIVRK